MEKEYFCVLYLLFSCAYSTEMHTNSKISDAQLNWQKRIINGIQSKVGQWPFLASIRNSKLSKALPDSKFLDDAICGGTIVGRRWILTAAHCVNYNFLKEAFSRSNITAFQDPKSFNVVLGEHEIGKDNIWRREHKVEEIYLPEGALGQNGNGGYDICLLKLRTKIKFNRRIRAMNLPKINAVFKPGTKCVVIGWGKQNESDAAYSATLRHVVVDIIDPTHCTADYAKSTELENSARDICAAGKGKDACQGDSGGPLICPDHKNRGVVAGVVSRGQGCGAVHFPGLYTAVAPFEKWISKVIMKKQKCTTC